MNIIRKLKITELSILTELFKYKNVDDMITENTHNIENGVVDIFALFDDNIIPIQKAKKAIKRCEHRINTASSVALTNQLFFIQNNIFFADF